MAEEKDVLDEVEGAEKKSPLPLILGILVAVLLLAGGGFYAYVTFIKEKPPAESVEPAGEKGADKTPDKNMGPALGVMFSLEPFVVNLAGSQGKRFLKVTISLELSVPEVHSEIEENLQKIVDSILVLLSSKNFEDVYSVQGKFKLKDEITTRVNRFLVAGHIKDAYFTEFIIQ